MNETVVFAVMQAAIAIAAWGGTALVRGHAEKKGIVDIPNDRSSHSRPTLRGGGLVIAIVWALEIPLLAMSGILPIPVAVALAAGVVIAAIGWWDDQHDVRAGVRLVAHLLAAVWTVFWLGGVPTVTFGNWVWNGGWLTSVLSVLGIVWLTNLYNFMDGIDGIAGVQALSGGAFMALILWPAGAHGLAFLAAGISAAAVGFLFWNWEPAKIFMGDVGSSLLGYAFAALALAAERTASVPAAVLLLPLGVFILDATYTLFRRLLRGERVYEAHRSHVYQRLVQQGWRHRSVSMLVLLIAAALGVLSLAAWRAPATLPLIVAGSVVGLALLAAVLLGARPSQARP